MSCPRILLGRVSKLKLQSFGHLMQKANTLEKTLMLRKTEGRKRGRNMRVEVSPTILVEETCMTFLALMCSFMEMVYRPWVNRLRIHQVMGSLKLIGLAKTSNLFLITFFHVKCLFLSSLRPSRTPTRKSVVER